MSLYTATQEIKLPAQL